MSYPRKNLLLYTGVFLYKETEVNVINTNGLILLSNLFSR